MPPVFLGRGFHKNSTFYFKGDGFYYHKNRRLKNWSLSLRCIKWYKEHCPGRAVLSRNHLTLRITTEHNCCCDHDFWKIRKLRGAILSRCSTRDTTRAKDIVAQEGESYERRVRMNCSSKILRSSIRRARMRMFPRIPKNLSELDEILRSVEYRHLSLTKEGDGYIFAGSCGSARTHSRCLIFQSPKMREIMSMATEVFADATWDGRPALPPSSQMFSITTLVNDGIVPLCVCLMERKNGFTYRILLHSIKALNPNFNPLKIHTDFEIAEFSAFKEVFRNVTVEGCLYHYSSNVSSQARTLGLAPYIAVCDTFDSLVRSCLAIPLVQTQLLRHALQAVRQRAAEENYLRILQPLFDYVNDEYISKRGNVLSVYGSENRTNNVSESWNNTLQQAMKVRRPNVFNFLSGLRNLEEHAHQDHFELTDGRNVTKGRKISAIINDRRIMNLTLLLERGQITMAHFLKASSRTLEKPYRRHCPRQQPPPPPQ